MIHIATPLYQGKYRAIVVDVKDPEERGRIRVTCPKVLGTAKSAWCEACIPVAHDHGGDFCLPPVGEAVWVEFEDGDVNKPVYSGGWYSSHKSPQPNYAIAEQERIISFKNTRIIFSENNITFEVNGLSATLQLTDWSDSVVFDGIDIRPLLPIASAIQAGVVKSGTDITVDDYGNVSINNNGHYHIISNISGLQEALDGKAPISHTHPISNVNGLQTALDGKSPVGHGHAISDTTNLQTSLDGKSPVGHTHVRANITDIGNIAGINTNASTSNYLRGDGTWVTPPDNDTIYTHPASHPPSIISQDASNRFVTDTEKATWNAKASTAVVTQTTNGLMSYTDKIKIDSTGYVLPQAVESTLGGVKAKAKTTENQEIAIDTSTGKLYAPSASNSLPVATSTVLGGVKSGTDITVDASGNVSVNNDSHTHVKANITDLGTVAGINTNASTSDYLRGDGTWVTPPNTTYANATTSVAGLMSTTDKTKLDGVASGAQVNVATNLAQGTRTSTTVPITSSTGTSATLEAATTSLAGLMSAADKTKLDGGSMSASEILTAIKTVDGSGSGLDAEYLNGVPISASGNRWGTVPYTDANGYTEVGTAIDFHSSDADTADSVARILFGSSQLNFNSALFLQKNGSDGYAVRNLNTDASSPCIWATRVYCSGGATVTFNFPTMSSSAYYVFATHESGDSDAYSAKGWLNSTSQGGACLEGSCSGYINILVVGWV